MRNQLDAVKKVIEVKNKRGRKSNDQQLIINSILTSIASTPTSDNKGKYILKLYSDIIS